MNFKMLNFDYCKFVFDHYQNFFSIGVSKANKICKVWMRKLGPEMNISTGDVYHISSKADQVFAHTMRVTYFRGGSNVNSVAEILPVLVFLSSRCI